MQEKTTNLASTKVLDPSRDRSEAAANAPFPPGRGTAQLVANFKAIVDARAIFYPVAYRFLKELGRGRQGIVYLGLRQGARGSTTRHAIKIFDPGIYPSAKKYWTDMGRIAAQTSRLQTVKSPNLVNTDIYEEYNGIGYVQMEMVDGVGLRYLLDGQHLDRVKKLSTPQEWASFTDVVFRLDGGKVRIQPGIVIYIARRVLRALETLHDLGFVHCDVKPANIMIDRLGYVRTIDYGRATQINEPLSFLLGTPMYMAPEIHRRERATAQSDLYSAGMVILEMLRGEPLIQARSISEGELLAFKMKLGEKLPELLPEYVRQNVKFVELMRRFIDPDPARRFSNAQEAESGRQGLSLVHKQLALLGKDTEYGRELENYLSKLVDPRTGQIEIEQTTQQ
jgi:serine/threonine protein kinase